MNTHALEELYLTFTAIQYRSNCNIPSLDINAHTFIDFEPVYKYWSAGLHRIYVFLMGILEVQIYVCKTEEEWIVLNYILIVHVCMSLILH